MRRICFDTESNYFKAGLGVGDIAYHRGEMAVWRKTNRMRLDAAVLYDEALDQIEEYRGDGAAAFVARLAEADELISHSGPRHDFLILEAILGAEAVAPLWPIRHHDLFDLGNWSKLDHLAKAHIPDLLPAIEEERDAGYADADKRWPKFTWGSSNDFRPPEFQVDTKLVTARFDVRRTMAVFKAMQGE